MSTAIVHRPWTVVHTGVGVFIGPHGKDRLVASPGADDHGTATHRLRLPGSTFTAWGRAWPSSPPTSGG